MNPTPALSRDTLADATLSSALDCMLVVDTRGRIVALNAAAKPTSGWARADLLGRLMAAAIVPHHHRHALHDHVHRQAMNRCRMSAAARIVGRRVEVKGVNAAGQVFQVELSISESRMGEDRFLVANLRAISAQKAAGA